MFCGNCGNQIPDGSAFCGKCGAKVGDGAAARQTAAPPYRQQGPNPGPGQQTYDRQQYQQPPAQTAWTPAAAQPKKSSVGSILFKAAGVVVVLFIVVSLLTSKDYISAVKAMKPVTGSSATYEEMADYYFESPKWKDRKGKNGAVFVDISGTSKINGDEVVLTIRIDPTDDPDYFWFTPYSVMINGQGRGEDAASAFVSRVCLAYQYGDGMYDLYALFDLIQAFS